VQNTDVTVIIRSAGERTSDLCRELVCEQVPSENVVVISEFPFREAARRSFEIGIELGRPWTLCLDADILLRRNAVRTLRNWALDAGDRALYIQGSILDKIFGRPRRAGPYFHKTSLLSLMLEHIPAEGVSLRPDTDAAMRLATLGYTHPLHDVVIAVHDFEQYYRDIYRKAFVHSHKHLEYMPSLELMWQRLAGQDPDYEVCLWGLRDGRDFKGTVSHDVRCFPKDISDRLGANEWKEKGPLKLIKDRSWDVDNVIAQFYRTSLLADYKFRNKN
jgi:hypothetical protein